MRLALPLSLSLLAHTLLVALLPDSDPDPDPDPEPPTALELEPEPEPVVVDLVNVDVGADVDVDVVVDGDGDGDVIATVNAHTTYRRPHTPDPLPPPPPSPPTPLPPRPYAPRIPTAHELARTLPVEPAPPPRDPLAPPTPRTPPRPPPSEMKPSGNGTRRVDQSVLTARVAADGKVTFEDKPNFQVRVALPSKRDIGKHLEQWAKDPYGTATADETAVETNTVTIIRGNFNLTDWAMRHMGNDPYQHRKLALLDRTRDERAGMAATATAENLHSSTSTLPRRLRAIWAATRWTAPQRRRLLFELWDDCAETGGDEVVTTANRVRGLIIAFIRRELPAGSPGAYPAAELAALNAGRLSARRFAPYTDTPEPP